MLPKRREVANFPGRKKAAFSLMLEIKLHDVVNDSDFHMKTTQTTLLFFFFSNGVIFAVSCGKF